MNYLSHYVFNHQVCDIAPTPAFVLGVALPDLWPRFSRRRRIHWRTVRTMRPAHPDARALQAGLLNHAEADRRFHQCAPFVSWLRDLKRGCRSEGTHPAVVDFVAHVSIELALDHHLLRWQPEIADEFYATLRAVDVDRIMPDVAQLTRASTAGLEDVVHGFIGRGFLLRYGDPAQLADIVQRVLRLTTVRERPSERLVRGVVDGAIRLVRPESVWSHLRPATMGSAVAVSA